MTKHISERVMGAGLRRASWVTLAGIALAIFAPDMAVAQLHNPCPYTNDGDCDEPNGLGYCAYGTDTVDCSNPNSNYGTGSGYAGGGGGNNLRNPCPYTNDGDCDEPNGLNLCAPGTDTVDCSNPNANYGSGSGYAGGGGGGTLRNPCPYTNDGDCDEPNGLGYCAPGTDTVDCSNPNSNFGSGSGYAGGTTPQQEPGAATAGATGGAVPMDQTGQGSGNCPPGTIELLGVCADGTGSPSK